MLSWFDISTFTIIEFAAAEIYYSRGINYINCTLNQLHNQSVANPVIINTLALI